ncbi:hypothetical protein TWF696_001172 [Orbilia brochopaga]|uniref:PQ-loop-domain-containing protein n=1 Tax=Orbilia brochopaga TaxID=3140254 RepID=A0AAV9UBW8_9PEZI
MLPLNEALSGIFGSISLTAWIFLIVPQLYENFRNQSVDGLSPLFLIFWMFGDVCNLIGAIWAKLLSTVIGLGAYFCGVDAVMLGQLVYYKYYRPQTGTLDRPSHRSLVPPQHEPGITDPLLQPDQSHLSDDPSQQNVRKSSRLRRRDSLSEAFSAKSSLREAAKNTVSVLIVLVTGVAGWVIAWKTGTWSPQGSAPSDTVAPLGALLLGYASSFFYLTARLPQIYKNFRRKSCDGLSVLFIILSTIGNLTYGASILSYSLDRNYLITNVPWLLGSLGTLVQDFVIFFQFNHYSRLKNRQAQIRPDASYTSQAA